MGRHVRVIAARPVGRRLARIAHVCQLLPTLDEGAGKATGREKVRCVYDPAKTSLQRLLLSGVLPAQKQQELTEVAHALDSIHLFQQVEQLQQAVFSCAVGCSPCVPGPPSAPLRVFSVECCSAGTLRVEKSVPDPSATIHTLYREQERRK